MPAPAVLIDVGGSLNTEVEHERLIDEDIRSALGRAGLVVTDAEYADAWRSAINSFAPNAYITVTLTLATADARVTEAVYHEMEEQSHVRGSFELRDGIPMLLERLPAQGLRLGLAANQPTQVVERLDQFGVGKYFHYRR